MRTMPGDHRCAKRWPRVLLAIVALAAMSACDGGDDGDDPVGAAGYTAVLDEFLPPVPSDGYRPVVFVARLDEDPFALTDQVEMIAAVEEDFDLRFVDTIDAAVDDDDADGSPRDDGLLLGIGTIPSAAPHVVRVEIYRAASRVDAYKVTLTASDGVWQVDTSEPVDPEVLLGDT